MSNPEQSPSENDELSEYDIYSKTPPRTKILRKNRERKMRDRQTSTPIAVAKKKAPFLRRNTTGALEEHVAEFFLSENNADEEEEEAPKRTSKRQMKLLRGSERDLKLDIARAQAVNTHHVSRDDTAIDYPRTPSYQIESNKRFMSLMGRTFPCKKLLCQKLKNIECAAEGNRKAEEWKKIEALKLLDYGKRQDFFHIMSSLIKMGENVSNNAKRAMSKEETLWQNELKDLIWLELQAYHADRTPMEEDSFLCQARECVEPLLNDIINYRFHKQSKKYISQNSDSGVEEDCSGCASISCYSCLEAQNDALKEIERLLKRLEDAESLFPSTNAFAELYPLYRSPEVVGRVRVMCQWYNITKHQRLKFNLLARLITLLESKQSDWPCFTVGNDNFSGSPSDSNSSTNSSTNSNDCYLSSDLFNITHVNIFLTQIDRTKVSPFRRYIENTLKTRALENSLRFIDRLHKRVLEKTQRTLELPKDPDIFSSLNVYHEEELCRYGCWSPEYASLDLPSYRGMYIFLATVPLEVIHEYLLMRLEQKPTNPSALSIRQLMVELKHGLKKAMFERALVCRYIEAGTAGTLFTCQEFKEKLSNFDDCVEKIFADYMDYLQQWIVPQNNFHKTKLEEAYEFSKEICEIYPHLTRKVGAKFACILGTILSNTGKKLIRRIDDSLNMIFENQEDADIKQTLYSICRKLQSVFIQEKETSVKTISFVRMHLKKDSVPRECVHFMKDNIMMFQSIVPNSVERVHTLFETVASTNLDEADKVALNNRIREILMKVFAFGFEFYKELHDLTADEYRSLLVKEMTHFAYLWMKFVKERCDRGRGIRPRWANQGLNYLISVIDPVNTILLTDEQFEELKTSMDVCFSHLIGSKTPNTPDSGFHSGSSRSSLEQMRARSRGSSPSPRPTYKSQRSGQTGRKISVEQQSPGVDGVDSTSIISVSSKKQDKHSARIENSKTRAEKFRDAVSAVDTNRNNILDEQNLIGRVLEDKTSNKCSIMRRNVNFSWQRGIKIGQGRFGKVYTAVNNNTGEMMAVKEIALQHNDVGTLKKIAEEMKILEGISHRNLVKSYGVEVHKDEMLIFMEYCSEGTLESLVADSEKGLPEYQARKYAFQLLSGVECLHDKGIVHRDIKTANIFLTNGGHCLKIGDFGCAVKIKSNMTMPGELKGFVGTQAYMAPEVFTKNMSEGHGRAVDIWSVGCVVIEMVSGQRPWAQFDSNVQIMFKVGMGQSPDPPDDMIDEGLDFLELCFKHDPKERATARELLVHDYVQVKLRSDDL